MRYNFNFCCLEMLLPDGTWWHPTARYWTVYYDGLADAPWPTDYWREMKRDSERSST